jgi:hypothetical protein
MQRGASQALCCWMFYMLRAYVYWLYFPGAGAKIITQIAVNFYAILVGRYFNLYNVNDSWP